MAEKILNKISFGESAVDVYLIADSAARVHMADSAVHVTAAEKSSWDGKQDAITSLSKLDYSLIANTPTIPAVNSAVVTISQGGVSKGSFNVNASSNVSINLDSAGGGTTPMLAVRMPYYNDGNKYYPNIYRYVFDGGYWTKILDTSENYSKVKYTYGDNNENFAPMASGGLSSSNKNVIAYIDVAGVLSEGDTFEIRWKIAGGSTEQGKMTFTWPCSPIMGGDEGGAGEANIIEAITFNGTSATITNKVAAITASIPTVNSPKITINQGGTSKGGFNLNQTDAATINLDAAGEANVLEGVQLNGTDLTVTGKKVYIEAITGITVNGAAAPVVDGVASITVTGGGGGTGGGITLAQARRQALIFG